MNETHQAISEQPGSPNLVAWSAHWFDILLTEGQEKAAGFGFFVIVLRGSYEDQITAVKPTTFRKRRRLDIDLKKLPPLQFQVREMSSLWQDSCP